MVLRRTLSQLSSEFSFIEAGCGKEAIDRYFLEEPDVLLLDVQLPGMEGWEILEWIRQVDQDVQIFMVTASGQPESVHKAIRLGANGFVGKPFDKEELADALGLSGSSRTNELSA